MLNYIASTNSIVYHFNVLNSNEKIIFLLINMNGDIVSEEHITTVNSNVVYNLDLCPNISKGIYFLCINELNILFYSKLDF